MCNLTYFAHHLRVSVILSSVVLDCIIVLEETFQRELHNQFWDCLLVYFLLLLYIHPLNVGFPCPHLPSKLSLREKEQGQFDLAALQPQFPILPLMAHIQNENFRAQRENIILEIMLGAIKDLKLTFDLGAA